MNPHDCKPGCCRTGTKQHCYTKWLCRCHRVVEVHRK